MMPVTTISTTPLSADGTVTTGWINVVNGFYVNVGVFAGADTGGTINILFSNDGNTTLVEMAGTCDTSNTGNNNVIVQGGLQYGEYSNLGILNTLSLAPYVKIEYVNGSTAQTKFMFGYYFYGKDDYFLSPSDSFSLADVGIKRNTGLVKSDLVSLLESIVKETKFSAVDSFSLSEIIKKETKIPQKDTFSVSDKGITKKALPVKEDSFALSDNRYNYHMNRQYSDEFPLSDVIAKRTAFPKEDAFSLTDEGVVKKALPVKNDSFTISDNGYNYHLKKNLKDSYSFSEIYQMLNKLIIEESISIVDLGVFKSIKRDETDSLTLIEFIEKHTTFTLDDLYSLIDKNLQNLIDIELIDSYPLIDEHLQKANDLNLNDIYSLVDKGTVKLLITNLMDNITLADFLNFKYSTEKSDAFSLKDLGILITSLLYMSFVDSYTLTDTIFKRINKPVGDEFSLSEVFNYLLEAVKFDNINLTDVITKDAKLKLADIYTLVDIVRKNTVGKNLADVFSLVDEGIKKELYKILIDEVSLGDIKVIKYIRKNLSDRFTFQETMQFLDNIFISESYNLTDVGITAKDITRHLSDEMVIEETLHYLLDKKLVDEYGLSDEIIKTIIKLLYEDEISFVDKISKDISFSLVDGVVLVDIIKKFVEKQLQDEISLIDYSLSYVFGYSDVVGLVGGFFNVAGIKPIGLYGVKYYDVLRGGNSAILYKGTENDEYVGFGRELYSDIEIIADAWLFGANQNLDALIASIHGQVEGWQPNNLSINGDKVMWVKLISEENLQSRVRGVALYRFVFQVRLYRQEVVV